MNTTDTKRYKLKDFAKWAKKVGLSDADLLEVLDEMGRGLLGDRLGSYVFKKRVALGSKGKRGGARMIVLFKKDDLVLFMYAYTKNKKEDLTRDEE